MKTNTLDRFKYLAKGVILAYIITIILMLIFSLLLTFTSIGEDKITLLNTIVMIASISLGSVYVTRKVKEQGWVNGGLVGIIYYLILIIIGLIFLKTMIVDIFSISKLVISGITGIIGGMIGINIS